MTAGERIRQNRLNKKMTQKELGEKAGIAEPTIRRYELGKLNPKFETLQKIATALSIPVTDLLTLEEEHETEDKKMENRYMVFLCNGSFDNIFYRDIDYIHIDDVNQDELNALLQIVNRHNQSNDDNIDLVIRALN